MTLTLWAVKNCTTPKQDLRQFYKALTTNCLTVDRPTLGPDDTMSNRQHLLFFFLIYLPPKLVGK